MRRVSPTQILLILTTKERIGGVVAPRIVVNP